MWHRSFDVDDEEPPELVSARNKLAMYSARPGEEEPRDLTEARRELAKRGVPIQQVEWQAGGDGDGEAPGEQYMPMKPQITPSEVPGISLA